MTDSPHPRDLSDASTNVRPTLAQAALMMAGGIVLALSSCGSFFVLLAQDPKDGSWGSVGIYVASALFALGVLLFFVGCLLIVVRIVRVSRRRSQGGQAAIP